MTEWLNDKLIDWLPEWQTNWLTDWTVYREAYKQMLHRQTLHRQTVLVGIRRKSISLFHQIYGNEIQLSCLTTRSWHTALQIQHIKVTFFLHICHVWHLSELFPKCVYTLNSCATTVGCIKKDTNILFKILMLKIELSDFFLWGIQRVGKNEVIPTNLRHFGQFLKILW